MTEKSAAFDYNSRQPTSYNYGPSNGYGGGNPGPSYVPHAPSAPIVAQPSSCLEQNFRNKPQSNSAGGACLIFISGGMNIAWSFGFTETLLPLTLEMKLSWFIAAIIGALISSVIVNRIKTKFIYVTASVPVIIGGILVTLASDKYNFIMSARYLDGFANGLVIVPTLIQAGEVAVKYNRGLLASSIESMMFSLGIYMQILYSIVTSESLYYSERWRGMLSILYGVLSILISAFLVVESPIKYLMDGKEEIAIKALCRLQRPNIVTQETYHTFYENKQYVAANKNMTFTESLRTGLPALMKLCFLRGLSAMTFSQMIKETLKLATPADGIFVQSMILGPMRFLGAIIIIFALDRAGRRKPMLCSIFICSALAITFGVLTSECHQSPHEIEEVMICMFVFQFFAGILSATSSVYMSEAFPYAAKSYFIAIAFTFEMIIQISICAAITNDYVNIVGYFYAFAGLGLLFFITSYFMFPETKCLTLVEVMVKFKESL